MNTISLVAKAILDHYRLKDSDRLMRLVWMLPIMNIIAGIYCFIQAGKKGGCGTLESRFHLIGNIFHGTVLILNLGFLLFVITNIVSLGITIKEKCSG